MPELGDIILNKKSKAERIYALFEKPSVEPSPNMVKIKKYSGNIREMKDDKMIYRDTDNQLLVVAWDTIRQKNEFDNGISFYFPDEKMKISAVYKNGVLAKYYCEVVEVEYKRESDTYIFTDLIVDVNLFENGKTEVLDEDELAETLGKGLVTKEESKEILSVKENILKKIKEDRILPEWCIGKAERNN